MSTYRAPIADIMGALDVADLDALLRLPQFKHVDRATVHAALAEFGRFVTEQIAPTDMLGDIRGSVFDPVTGSVAVPDEFHQAYRGLVEGGWTSLAFPSEWGGDGLPGLVGIAIQEMLASANVSLSLNPTLTQSAVELLLVSGSENQKRRFLPHMMTGAWSGTMDLTEPGAGSDLGEIRTVAEPDGDRWRVTGTKVFITWGDHNLNENIIHLVLARTPGAPPDSRGLSIFLVPKHLVDDVGQVGDRNTVTCLRVERKVGLHASPTCVLEFDKATAELVGPLHGGMHTMFTMMNVARLAIAVQGPSIGEVAYQQALDYAHTRRQGKSASAADSDRSLIVKHPDVQRMLLTMRVLTLASRLLVYLAAGYRDRARYEIDANDRALAQEYLALLTPVAKAWATGTGVQIASLGIQVMGGIGYVEESGMAQRWRDSRIGPIYEGTNGIQAIDLVTRKIPHRDGAPVRTLIEEMAKTVRLHQTDPDFAESLQILTEALDILNAATDWVLERVIAARDDVLAGASTYLDLLGIVLGGWLMLRRSLIARGTDHAEKLAAESRFYAIEILARAPGLIRPITGGANRLDGALWT